MSESNQIEVLVAKSIEFVEHAETFAAEQMPIVVQEILTRGIISASVAIAMWVTLMIIFIAVAVFSYIKAEDSGEEGWMIAWALGGIGGIIGCVGVFFNVYSLFVVIYCPRIYVLEHLAKLVT